MSAGPGMLLDGRRQPSLRSVVGRLLARATAADFAISRVRLAAIDLTPDELDNVQRCRVLLGRLDIDALVAPLDHAGRTSDRTPHLTALRAFLASGRATVRTAGTTLWLPDFSVLSGPAEHDSVPAGGVCLVGAHYFARPYPTRGPALTCLLSDARSVARARERFDELWELGYDVLPVITETLDALLADSVSNGARSHGALPASGGRLGGGPSSEPSHADPCS